uniref:phosphorylase b kinase regulatory subunit alpha, skeletal muscle isoform-like isoform X2 n=1 Tax=Styela clava TaxID=7725 RepID=UPI0019397AA6|nr:phosphorylase b kinase regulatory subunit alpha, skeletal muscle isoform-like isoform X2 [Styela clava]
MRSRSNSGVKLDNYARLIQKTILKFQDPVTGLFPAGKDEPHAWVRDNLYCIQSVWGLSLAYKKHADLDEDKAKAYELGQSVVKCMRSLLNCMMRQVDKLERFKTTQSTNDALHAKYNRHNCNTVVGDKDWGHLQLDAVGLYLLMLSQMTASGMSIIYSLDEVSFVQNLVFYIESAYRTPDYGIWERGDKTNHGVPELNASSVGMCKAALEAIDELDLFGGRGGPQSVIHVTQDEKAQNLAILYSMLPRESNSKEVDASLLSVIGYPAFAVSDENLVKLTRETVVKKLQGNYGCCRFLRDGYKTALEDPNRLHYELAELKVFEDIECEWPLFWTYLILDGIFFNNQQQVIEYREALEEILVIDDGVKVIPELYTVPADLVELEKSDPHSQIRVPMGKIPHLWGHSLYILGELLWDGFLVPGEIDPLNRRFVISPKPDLVVQGILLSENKDIQQKLLMHNIETETMDEIAPIRIQPAKALSIIYSQLGKNAKLKVSGRPTNRIGVLGTSKLYVIRGNTFIFTPQFLDQEDFYMSLDTDMSIDMLMTELQYLSNHWTMPGRPTITIPITSRNIDQTGENISPHLISTIKKISNGYLNGVRVVMGRIESMLSTSCITELNFLNVGNLQGDEFSQYLDSLLKPSVPRMRKLDTASSQTSINEKQRRLSRMNSNLRRKSADLTKNYHLTFHFKDVSSLHDLNIVRHGRKALGKLVGSQSDFTSAKHRKSCSDFETSTTMYNKRRGGQYIGHSDESLGGSQDINSLLKQLVSPDAQTEEQADILHYLYINKGPEWDTRLGGGPAPVIELVEELYDKAGMESNWLVVRQVTGLLKKRVNGLSQSVTDLLVRQKQLTVGLPPEPREKTITRPLPLEDLHKLIMDAFGEDTDIAVLTQEIIMYLAMFIRSSPGLFSDLLRLRVGLIIQVMASELARHLKCSGEEASIQLMSLSPYEMKRLIHNILSGKEFGITKSERTHASSADISVKTTEVSFKADKNRFANLKQKLKSRDLTRTISRPLSIDSSSSSSSTTTPLSPTIAMKQLIIPNIFTQCSDQEYSALADEPSEYSGEKRGQWIRRRRIDGALNRVPHKFYCHIWRLLEKCYGLMIGVHYVPGYVTKEMTEGELKFALLVENVLNHIPQPEYRQLIVETMVILSLIANAQGLPFLNDNIRVDQILIKASDLFYDDMVKQSAPPSMLVRDTASGICTEFYDCAPSGTYGTMSYLSKAVAETFSSYFPKHVQDCFVS